MTDFASFAQSEAEHVLQLAVEPSQSTICRRRGFLKKNNIIRRKYIESPW